VAWLYKRNDSKKWWIGYRQNGKLILKSTKTTDKETAKVELAKVDAMLGLQASNALSREFYEAISGTKLPNLTLKAGLASWLAVAQGTTGEGTQSKYAAVAGELESHFNATDRGPMLADVTKEQLREFLTSKRNRTSAATANQFRTIIAGFFRHCRACGFLRDNPMEGLPAFKATREEDRARRPFTATELATLYEVAPDDFWRYMVLGGYFTGLRLGDLVTMPTGAVDWKARVIRLATRKTGRSMTIPIAPQLFRFLKELKAKRPNAKATDPFWPEMAERYEQSGASWFSQRFTDLLLVKAGLAPRTPHRKKKNAKSHKEARKVNEVSFHCLRHSYVTTLASLGMNQQTVKALAGHSSDEISDLYTTLPLATMRDAVAQLPNITTEVAR
jgi:integrase